MEKNFFSENLIFFRKARNYSQHDLAKITGLSQRLINYYENNPNSIPIKKLKLITDALDITISDLFGYKIKENQIINETDLKLIKKIHAIKELPDRDQRAINNFLNTIFEKNKLKKEKSKQLAESKK